MVSTECQHRLNNVYFHLLEDFRPSVNLSGPGSLWLLASNRNTSAPCTFPASHSCAERPGAPNCNSRPPSGCPALSKQPSHSKGSFFLNYPWPEHCFPISSPRLNPHLPSIPWRVSPLHASCLRSTTNQPEDLILMVP